jgi:hypothetical protein
MSTLVIDGQIRSKNRFVGNLVTFGGEFTPGDLAPT